MIEKKNELRKKAIGILSQVSGSDFDKWNISLSKNLNNFLSNSMLGNKVIGGYAPIFREPVWMNAVSENSRLAFPCFDEQMFYRLSQFSELEKRVDFGFEILGPRENTQIIDPEILLIPGLSFSPEGERLGRGKGFYDRFLENFKGIKIGLCFECQIENGIPTEEHDKKMDFIVTEKKIYRI